ncbi:MAG: polyprenyl synthetase family protein [Crocinitomicaceae bacterium TMED135]|nr:MAG: polyprenyl synthetase [Bacteroidetes bacterium MED-G20]RPG79872.1 MAG: polyprenyl synthetase family protein [Crocinitomicaceae bacterium TMED135]
MTVDDIKKPVKEEMALFEKKFKSAMKSDVALLDKITHYIIKRKGKQLRPLFVFLSAKMIAPVEEGTYIAASLIELLHTATLVHDDVVDDASERRGFLSINALWKNKIAVLVGDFLLSQGLLLTTSKNRIDLLHLVSKAVKAMSEGELLQMEKSRKMDITEEVYYKIIKQKTASLVAACCATGACSVTKDKELIANMEQVGIYVGMAFQIKDDIFDYGFSNEIGKPTGIDIKERKLTLPLIYVMNKVDNKQKKLIIKTIKKDKQDAKKINEIISLVINEGGIHYAEKKMHFYKDLALKQLDYLPSSPSKEAFIGLINYSINRKK